MVPKKFSLSTIDDITNDIPQYRGRGITLDTYGNSNFEQPTCRICLQNCQNISYCYCKGSSMVHEACLRQYVLKGSGSVLSRTKCEICQSKFRFLMSKNCSFSCSNGCKSFKDNRMASVFFIIYCIVIVIYGGYCLYLNTNKFLNNELQLILMSVGICLLLILFGILVKWLIKNMWVRLIVLQRILPITRARAQSLQLQDNDYRRNQTMQQM